MALKQTILDCVNQRTLRLIAIDEAHFYAQHGKLFRRELRILKSIFFSVIFNAGGGIYYF